MNSDYWKGMAQLDYVQKNVACCECTFLLRGLKMEYFTYNRKDYQT